MRCIWLKGVWRDSLKPLDGFKIYTIGTVVSCFYELSYHMFMIVYAYLHDIQASSIPEATMRTPKT